MTTPSARKGNNFERLVVTYLRDQFGAHLSRPRCGAAKDLGDIAGVPGWTFEAKSYANLTSGIREGLKDLEVEQANAGTPYGAVILKRHGTTDPTRQLFLMELGPATQIIRETATWDAMGAAS